MVQSLLLFGVLDFFEEFGGLFLEGIEADFAAELDLLAIVDEDVGRAVAAQLVARDDAGLERIAFGRRRVFGVVGYIVRLEGWWPEGDESEDS